uniref:Uncharacterized protein n=1 Tax=mine drainage metagenome TaxID=410659 RepID=E6QJV6_9ZZZZ
MILHLRAEDDDHKFDDLLSNWKLKSIISRYSDHISLPIEMRKREWNQEKGQEEVLDTWEQINKACSSGWPRGAPGPIRTVPMWPGRSEPPGPPEMGQATR